MRLAWLGPVGNYGGVPVMNVSLIRAMGQIAEVHAFTTRDHDTPVLDLGVPTTWAASGFRWNAALMNQPLVAQALQLGLRAGAQARLAAAVLREHRVRPFDAVVQISQVESPALDALRHRLPPIVAYPCTSVTQERAFFLQESTGVGRSRLAAEYLRLRAHSQRRALSRRDLVLGPSQRFVAQLGRRLRLDEHAVIPHCVDLNRFCAVAPPREGPIRLLCPTRLATRKGVEVVVALSHELRDLAGDVEIVVAGDRSLWSDRSDLLNGLNRDVGRYIGNVNAEEMPALYASAHAVIVPSLYEPGSLVTLEALACGRPVFASDAVGPAEDVPPPACVQHPAGDVDALAQGIRAALPSVRDRSGALRSVCRAVAEQQFAPPVIAARFVDELTRALRHEGLPSATSGESRGRP